MITVEVWADEEDLIWAEEVPEGVVDLVAHEVWAVLEEEVVEVVEEVAIRI